jgi:hypothetical protein
MTEDAADLLAELRKLIADLKGTSDAAYFPPPDEMLTMKAASVYMRGQSIRGGNRISPSTIDRWREEGWRGIFLRCIPFMYRWYTCKRWLTDFVKTCSQVEQIRGNPSWLKRGGGQPYAVLRKNLQRKGANPS